MRPAGTVSVLAVLLLTGCGSVAALTPVTPPSASAPVSPSAASPPPASSSTAAPSCSASSPDALLQLYLCDPNVYRGLQTVTDSKYGFQVPVPQGWWVDVTDKVPLAQSADLFLWEGNVHGQTSSVTVRVCTDTAGPCAPPSAAGPSVTRKSAALANVPATLIQQPNTDCVKSAAPTADVIQRCGFEWHELATRGRFTFEVTGRPLAGSTSPSPQFDQVLAGWRWLGA